MRMSCHEFGPANAPRGLWIHGFMGDGQQGADLQRALGPGFRLCCPDLPGHGTTPVSGWTLADTLDALAELASDCAWAGGYSMGGRLLMMAAAKHPEAFRDLVIESASLGCADPHERARRRELDRQRADELIAVGLTAFREKWYRMEMWGGWTPSTPATGDEPGLAAALTRFSTGNQPDMRLWLSTTTCRVLWLAGSRDPGYVQQAQWVERHTRHSPVLLDAGHNPHRQQPAAWADALRHFLLTDPQLLLTDPQPQDQ
ncbi:MAG: alpha/beta fold hydrolase [Kiritimatiellia bacterium]